MSMPLSRRSFTRPATPWSNEASRAPLRLVSATVAGAAAVTAWALPLKLNILVAIATAVVVCLVIEQAMGKTEPRHA
jgi:hypothetical protein